MSTTKLLGLSGSLRRGSYNTMLLHEAAHVFGDADLSIADIDLPLFNEDNEAANGIPASVQMLADQVAAADAVLISTSEYNKGISGALKNALDRGPPSFWAGKATGIVDCWCWRWCGNWARSTCTPPNWCISGLSFCQCARSSNCPLQ
jgi:chromate reductase